MTYKVRPLDNLDNFNSLVVKLFSKSKKRKSFDSFIQKTYIVLLNIHSFGGEG